MQVPMFPWKPRRHAFRYKDWCAFGARCQHSPTPDIEDLSQWTDQLLADLHGVTASIATRQNTWRMIPALLTWRPLIQASRSGGTSNGMNVVFAAESHTSTGRSKRTQPFLLAGRGNSCAREFPVSWAVSNHGIFYAIFSTLRVRSLSPGRNWRV
ncbi:hypothetical protein MTO96_028878 [Rhipicephalus appendiculatus]